MDETWNTGLGSVPVKTRRALANPSRHSKSYLHTLAMSIKHMKHEISMCALKLRVHPPTQGNGSGSERSVKNEVTGRKARQETLCADGSSIQ
jgi:hypothetical protein